MQKNPMQLRSPGSAISTVRTASVFQLSTSCLAAVHFNLQVEGGDAHFQKLARRDAKVVVKATDIFRWLKPSEWASPTMSLTSPQN